MLMYGGQWGEVTRGGIFNTDNDYDLAYSNGFWLGSRHYPLIYQSKNSIKII